MPLAELDQGQCDQSLVLLLVVSAIGALEVVLGDQVEDAPVEGVDLEAVVLGTVGNPGAVGLMEAIEVGQGSGDQRVAGDEDEGVFLAVGVDGLAINFVGELWGGDDLLAISCLPLLNVNGLEVGEVLLRGQGVLNFLDISLFPPNCHDTDGQLWIRFHSFNVSIFCCDLIDVLNTKRNSF